jgi:hypothetical protein
MLNVIMLSVAILNVVMLNDVAAFGRFYGALFFGFFMSIPKIILDRNQTPKQK